MKKSKKKGFKLPKYSTAGLYPDPQLGASMSANQGLTGRDKEMANSAFMNQAADKGIQMIPGFGQYYGLAKGASDFGRNMIGKDDQGMAHSNMEQAADDFMKPTHTAIIDNASKGQHGEAVMSAFINPAIGSLVGEAFKGTKFGDKATAYGRGEKIFKEGGVYNLMHPFNNLNFNIPMFPMGGNTDFGGNAQLEKQENTLNPDGTTTQFNLPTHENQDPNEGTKLDPGTLIFSDRLKPKGSKITFAILNKSNNTDKEDKILDNTASDTLAKKTAQLMKDAKHKQSLKLFQEQELLKQSKANNYIKRLGGVMQFPDGGKIYPASEEDIKYNKDWFNRYKDAVMRSGMSHDLMLNSKIGSNAYDIMLKYETMKVPDNIKYSTEGINKLNHAISSYEEQYMGKNNPLKEYPDGGQVDAMGFPIDKTGRRLSPQEQMGFNRPAYTYNTYTGSLAGPGQVGANGSGINPNTGKAFMPLQNAGMNQGMTTPTNTGVKPFTYTAGQTDANGRPISYNDAWNTYMSTQTDAYGKPLKQKLGGVMPKYKNGDRLQEMNSEEPQMLDPKDLGYANYKDWSDVRRAELQMDSDMAKQPFTYQAKTQSTPTNMDWKNMAYQAGMWAANNAGEMAYLKDQGKKYDTQKEYTYKPTLLDPTASLRDITNEGMIAKYDLADKSSGNSGNYLSNRSGLATSIGLAKDKVRREYANANASISNQGQLTNIQNKYMVDDINARNKGAALNQYYKSIERMGTNTAQMGKDNKASQMDQKTLDMMGSMFANYKYDPKTNSWIFKK